jgi:hypothetical protein
VAGPNLDPKVTAGQALGDDEGGNTDQPDQPAGEPTGGMTTENAGALTGSAGYAKAKKATSK